MPRAHQSAFTSVKISRPRVNVLMIYNNNLAWFVFIFTPVQLINYNFPGCCLEAGAYQGKPVSGSRPTGTPHSAWEGRHRE